MSVSERPFLRLFVHCRDRKFVQLARPSDSLGDLALTIQAKYSKLYSGRQIRAPRLQCADRFDLDVDDVVADVFEDRDHIYIDLSDNDDNQTPAKKTCFRSPASTTTMPQQKTMLGQSGGSPIQHKITPVLSLPNVTETPKSGAQKVSDDDSSSTNSLPLAQTTAKPTAKKPMSRKSASEPKKALTQAKEKELPKQDAPEPIKATSQKKESATKSKRTTANSVPIEPNQPTFEQNEAIVEANGSVTQPRKLRKEKKSKGNNATENVPDPEKDEAIEDAQVQSENIAEGAQIDDDKDDDKLEISSNDEMATCKKCQETMPKKSLKYHQRQHYEHHCSLCPKKFGSSRGLERHLEKDH